MKKTVIISPQLQGTFDELWGDREIDAVSENISVISTATARNWKKLHSKSAGRLTARANKRRSQKQIIPFEYFSDKNNVALVQELVSFFDKTREDLFSIIYSLSLRLLKEANIDRKPHVLQTLEEYSKGGSLVDVANLHLPKNEWDLLGLIYQSFLDEGTKNTTGRYYTPQKIARSMTQDFVFSSGQTFLDPCCGSGAFLLSLNDADPRHLYGIDNDPIAVLIAKINLLLHYPDEEFIPQIFCHDFLATGDFYQQLPALRRKFDYIATNPPWGAMKTDRCIINRISSNETYSAFFVKSTQYLKQNGTIRFLFPQSILNVKTHRDIRKFILKTAGLVSVTEYDSMFAGVTTKYVDIRCGNGADPFFFMLYSGNRARKVALSSVEETKNLVINMLNCDDIEILRIVKEKGAYTLQNSIWALGIVTGDNKNKLFSLPETGMEKIYTGKEIRPYFLLPAKKFFYYDKNTLQQTAKEEIYRAPEKLVYKFISDKLVFAYDCTGSFFLNSANILIPSIPQMNIKTIMAFLNSTLFQFVYSKLFGEVKILKGNLSELLFPRITVQDDVKLAELATAVQKLGQSKIDEIDEYIFAMYSLSEKQIDYIRSVVNGKTRRRAEAAD